MLKITQYLYNPLNSVLIDCRGFKSRSRLTAKQSSRFDINFSEERDASQQRDTGNNMIRIYEDL